MTGAERETPPPPPPPHTRLTCVRQLACSITAAPTALRATPSSQRLRRLAVLAPASPTTTLWKRSSGVVGLRPLDGTEAAARKPECARWRAGALACMALLMLRDRRREAGTAAVVRCEGGLTARARCFPPVSSFSTAASPPTLVGRVRVCGPPQRGRRKGSWRARARQDASFKSRRTERSAPPEATKCPWCRPIPERQGVTGGSKPPRGVGRVDRDVWRHLLFACLDKKQVSIGTPGTGGNKG
eukprot:7390163-Prymnesium_polylepis.1